MADADAHPCIQCRRPIHGRSQAIACDGCGLWNHRKCGTGITQQQYRAMMRRDESIAWRCQQCIDAPADRSRHNSTAMEDEVPPPLEVDLSPMRNSRGGDEADVGIPDVTFDLTGRDFQRPAAPADDSLPDRPITVDIPDDQPVTYEVVEAGSTRGAPKLVTSDGYTFTSNGERGGRKYWRCHVRRKEMKCPATIREFRGMYTPGVGGHVHPADPCAAKKVKMSRKVKDAAKERRFEPAAAIVERIMKDMVVPDDVNLPKPTNLVRRANYNRRERPKDPTDLTFELDRDFIGEDFLIEDVQTANGARHIIFGTQDQLELLKKAKRWFLDGTFKVVKEPFYQLVTINVFVKKEENEKQVPLAYALMSNKTKDDYVTVLTTLKRHLGQPMVEWIMVDFEAGIWQALREVFPNSIVKGCVFHLQQRLYRKVQGKGLQQAYIEKGDVYTFIRKVMALPYLPAEQIVAAFDRLKVVAEEAGGPVQSYMDYVESTWIRGPVWQPTNWCVFREVTRTNNDLEGWHRRLNARAGNPNLGLYKLVTILREEAETVDLTIRLVSDSLISKIRRKRYVQLHGRLEEAWDMYEDDQLTTTEMLRRISRINGLGATTAARHLIDDDDEA